MRSDNLENGSFFPFPRIPENPPFTFSRKLALFLQGKELLINEIPFSQAELQIHCENGYVAFVQAIVKKDGRYECLRCGNRDKRLFASFLCARCQKCCVYCRKCVELGRVSECTPLVHWTGPIIATNNVSKHLLAWDGELTAAQEKAAKAIVRAIQERSELLVWAVAGSGKTEMLFLGIEHALNEQLKVVIATPRTDVVLELVPRLKKAFPCTNVLALYGLSPDRKKAGELYIATTHQLLRFYEAFDVVIIDEVDAFPYSYDESLQYAVKKAKKSSATIIYLTATPSREMQKRVQRNDLPCVKVNRRYHTKPLPVPRFQWCGNWQRTLRKNKIPKPLLHWLKKHEQKPVFIFVPTINILQKVTELLKNYSCSCEGVHADDPERHNKINNFREGKIPILVTTTILERGVTIPNVQVAVFGADHDIFTESALVQIAGRAGRAKEFPDGDVVFFHYGITKSMRQAKKHIEAMNAMP